VPMTEKYAVLIKYKYLEYIESAKLSDTDAWKLIHSIIEYDKTEEIPVFENPVLTGIFAVIKLDLDQNKKNWNAVSQVKSDSGKKGGAPKGNQNARKNKQNNQKQAKQPNAYFSQKNKQKQHDSDSDLDLGNEFESGGGNIDFKTKKPPPLILKKIISEAHRLEFIIDEKKAVEFYRSGIDPAWYEGPYSFLAFAAEKVTTAKNYRDKPHDEQQNLFNSAVISWKNLRGEYPLRLEKQKQADVEKSRQEAQKQAAAEKEAELQKARESEPKVCGRCGNPLDEMLACRECRVLYVLDEGSLKFHPKPMNKFTMDHYAKKNTAGGPA
jgi:hypothetical protein